MKIAVGIATLRWSALGGSGAYLVGHWLPRYLL